MGPRGGGGGALLRLARLVCGALVLELRGGAAWQLDPNAEVELVPLPPAKKRRGPLTFEERPSVAPRQEERETGGRACNPAPTPSPETKGRCVFFWR